MAYAWQHFSLSHCLCMCFVYLIVREANESAQKKGKKRKRKSGKIIYSSGVTRTIHKYCHSVHVYWLNFACSCCNGNWLPSNCACLHEHRLQHRNVTSLVSLRYDWSLNKWLCSHLKWKNALWKISYWIHSGGKQSTMWTVQCSHFHSEYKWNKRRLG